MPTKHDLFADLQLTREEVEKRTASDPKLSALLSKYASIDADVVEKEANYTADELVKRNKEKRLQIKDEIVRHLGNSGAK